MKRVQINETIRGILSSLPLLESAKLDWIRDGVLHKEQFVFTHRTAEGTFQLPESVESSGTFQMLMLSVLLYKVLHEERIMIIDEIESSLHYELLSYFVRTFIASSENTFTDSLYHPRFESSQ